MMRLRLSYILPCALLFLPGVAGAESPDEFFNRINRDYEEFAQKTKGEFESFRRRVNREYAEFMARPWKPVSTIAPQRRSVLPDPVPLTDTEPKPEVAPGIIPGLTIADDTTPIDNAAATRRPTPQEPIKPLTPSKSKPQLSLQLYGATLSVSRVELGGFRIAGNNEAAFAEGWKALAELDTDNLLADCLRERDRLRLPDWHYLLMIERIAGKLAGQRTNEHTLLAGYLLNRSGFDVRFGLTRTNGQLHLLFGTTDTFYNRPGYNLRNGRYYSLTAVAEPISVCDFTTPGETKLSIAMDELPALPFAAGNSREITVDNSLKLNITINKNLIDFYSDYPDAAAGNSELTRWAAYSSAPASEEIRRNIYPRLRKAVEGLSQYDAVNLLLRVAQKFPYGYDSEIWGGERVFFMDESWHYPKSDCEDHAINFTRMVRDVLGLEACLLSYPNHLAAGVVITDGTARGTVYRHNGRAYMSCDATYFGAAAGSVMPKFKSSGAKIIPVK